MEKMNVLSIIIICAGIIGAVFVWNYRYDVAYDLGSVTGFNDGNLTGFADGYDEGFSSGWVIGAFDGKEIGLKSGYEIGVKIGYDTGYENGEDVGYQDGFYNGVEYGSNEGYLSGIISGSKSSTLRDPTYDEAMHFLRSVNTRSLKSIRKNAFNVGYRSFLVRVEVKGLDGGIRLFGFDSIDEGMIYFEYQNGNILDIQIGDPCFDRTRYAKPKYDDTITGIQYIS